MKKLLCVAFVSGLCAMLTPTDAFAASLTPENSVNDEVITKPDGGTAIDGLFRISESGYYYFGAGETKLIDGEEGHLVIDGDDIYILNPLIGGVTNTWVKGTLSADGAVTVPTPQLISGGSGDSFAYYLLNGVFDEATATATVNEEETDIIYSYKDGVLTLVKGNPSIFEFTEPYDIMGDPVGDSKEWVWEGDIAFSDEFKPYPALGESAPENAVSVDYILYTMSEGVTEGLPVKVAFVGNDCWVQGLEINMPDVWAKGIVEGDKIIFRSQYMCLDTKSHIFQFLIPGRAIVEDGVTVGYEMCEEVVMDYNAAEGSIVSPKGSVLFVNGGQTSIFALSKYEDATFRKRVELTSFVPADPVIISYTPYDIESGFGGLNIALPQVNVNGEYLDSSKLYYSLMLDGEPFAIDSEYFPNTEETLWEVPYDFYNYDISVSGVVHSLYFCADINDPGVKLMYYDDKGNVYESNIVYVSGNGVENTETVAEAVAEIFTDIAGCRVGPDYKGLCIRTVIFKDGSRKVTKMMK